MTWQGELLGVWNVTKHSFNYFGEVNIAWKTNWSILTRYYWVNLEICECKLTCSHNPPQTLKIRKTTNQECFLRGTQRLQSQLLALAPFIPLALLVACGQFSFSFLCLSSVNWATRIKTTVTNLRALCVWWHILHTLVAQKLSSTFSPFSASFTLIVTLQSMLSPGWKPHWKKRKSCALYSI